LAPRRARSRTSCTWTSTTPPHRALARDWSARIAASRIAEVAAGHAAAFGLLVAAASETLLRQSVQSQLVGRWEGAARMEAALPTARVAAFFVLVAAAAATLAEASATQRLLLVGRTLGLPPRAQLWAGRAAMAVLSVLVVAEAAQGNRPCFPCFFLI
jgi:hypothetical protein